MRLNDSNKVNSNPQKEYISRWWFGFRLEQFTLLPHLSPEMMLGIKEVKIDTKISNSRC